MESYLIHNLMTLLHKWDFSSFIGMYSYWIVFFLFERIANKNRFYYRRKQKNKGHNFRTTTKTN